MSTSKKWLYFLLGYTLLTVACNLAAPSVGKELAVANHTVSEGGFLHQSGLDNPFSNNCSSCHGSDLKGAIYTVDAGTAKQRKVRAPSCYQCHGVKWDGN